MNRITDAFENITLPQLRCADGNEVCGKLFSVRCLQNCATNEEKNVKMVDLLALLGRSTVGKFCDALQLSGHGFLSEFLRDEGIFVRDGIAIAHVGVLKLENECYNDFKK